MNYFRFGNFDVDGFLEAYLDFHDVTSVQFSYTEYEEGSEYGTRTTIEKVRYAVEDLDS